MYTDRTDAGRQLATALRERGLEADLVLAVPRGGLPVGRAVADALDAPLDVVVARKVGAPHNPELALGAVAADGTAVINDDLVETLGLDDEVVHEGIDRERAAAESKRARYRSGRPPLDLAGKTVVVVDDGVATGATTVACLRSVRAAGPRRLVLAVPVGPQESIERLAAEADEVVCLETPTHFGAVGRFYASFDQVSDEAAMAYLEPG